MSLLSPYRNIESFTFTAANEAKRIWMSCSPTMWIHSQFQCSTERTLFMVVQPARRPSLSHHLVIHCAQRLTVIAMRFIYFLYV